jgi:hypothetical protein
MGTALSYSDGMLIFSLKEAMPHKYRDRADGGTAKPTI